MPDELFTRPASLPRRAPGPSTRTILVLTLLAFVGGAGLTGWLAWSGRVHLGKSAPVAAPARPVQVAALPNAAPTVQAGGFDARLAALEQRLARLDLQAAASEGNTARAEALLLAFAARRAIERGAPVQGIADQLRLRFGAAQGQAVEAVIAAAPRQVTLDKLAAQLEALGPDLAAAPPEETGLNRLSRELSTLFVIRKADSPSTRPEDRLEQARLLLRSGQVGKAADTVAQLPGSAAANGWIATARQYAATLAALDLLETAALAEPEKLKDSTGEAVRQPGVSTGTLSEGEY